MNLLTTRDVQSLIKVDRSTIYRMAEDGRLPGIKVGRQWRFPEDRLTECLGGGESAFDRQTEGDTLDLRDLVTPGSLQAVADLLAELLGTMVIITDMAGRPVADVANPCGLFQAVHDHPGVLERCIAGWQQLAGELDMEAQWRPTPLGFLCARSLVRVGDQLTGMVMAGGIAPAVWPPGVDEVRRLATGLGVPAALFHRHVTEVHRLDRGDQDRALRLLPRAGVLISRLAKERAGLVDGPGAGASPTGQRRQTSMP